ncbi:hypothetical protein THRCLA_10387 [Thraustotheca clavata]|uniref:EF-hand domain-containing protein n=1 Tax=Thraustotheca clavata TaxID=74557 RepID=A0A1V9YR59_9STRA|nr:hypothetical protein THRCLA_10387 [Thraustotheca clavata]
MDIMMTLSTEDVRRLKSKFVRPLTIDEFVFTMIKSLQEQIQNEVEFVIDVIELFETIDVNGDGSLEWDEFAGYIMDAGIAKAEEAISAQSAVKLYTKLNFKGEAANTTQPMVAEHTYIAQLLLLSGRNALSYFEHNADVVHIYTVSYDRDIEPRYASTIRLHTAYQAHKVLAIEEVSTRSILIISSYLQNGCITLWDINRLYGPVPLHRFEAACPHEHLLWVASSQLLLTGASQNHVDVKAHKKGSNKNGNNRKPINPYIAAYDITTYHRLELEIDAKCITTVCLIKRSTRSAVALGSINGIITIHEFIKDQTNIVIEAHEKGVKVIAYSPKYTYLASIGHYSFAEESTMEILIWNVQDGSLQHTLRGHHAAMCTIIPVDSESHLLSSDEMGSCRVWSTSNWDCLQVFDVHTAAMGTLRSQLVIPPTSQADALLLCGGKTIEYFDCTITREREEFIFMSFNATLNLITAATCHRLILWDVVTGKATKVYGLQIIYNERPVCGITAVCTDDRERDDAGQILVVNMVNGNLMKELDPHSQAITSISYAAKAKCVISTAMDSSIHICDENNAHGYYVPFAGAPLSVLLRSIHLEAPPPGINQKPNILGRSRPTSASSDNEEKQFAKVSGNFSNAQGSVDIVNGQVSEAWELIATMAYISGSIGECYLQMWDFYTPHLVGSCVSPRRNCGELTCFEFLTMYPGIVAGFSNGEVFIWGIRNSVAPSQCIFELKHTYKSSAIASIHVVNQPSKGKTSSDLWIYCGDEAGRVTRWSLTREMCHRYLLPKEGISITNEPSVNDQDDSTPPTETTNRHTHTEIPWDTIYRSVKFAKAAQTIQPFAIYHDLQWQASAFIASNSIIPSVAITKLSSIPCLNGAISILTCSMTSKVKAWTSEGDPEGTLDYFATRREPVQVPWTVPVDTVSLHRVKEAQARELCAKVHTLDLAIRDTTHREKPLQSSPNVLLGNKTPLGNPTPKLTPRTCARFKSLSQLVNRKNKLSTEDNLNNVPLDAVLHELSQLNDVTTQRHISVRKKREIKTVEGILEMQRSSSLSSLPSKAPLLKPTLFQSNLKPKLPKLVKQPESQLESVLSYHMKLAHSWQQ